MVKTETGRRLLSYSQLVKYFGQTKWYWRQLQWKGLIVNCNPVKDSKHLFDERDIVQLIEESKVA